MNRSTVCFFRKDGLVGMARKKKKIGAGRLNGWGGKFEDDENAISCSIRELGEEAGVLVAPEGLERVALIDFYLDGVITFSCDVLFVVAWEGEIGETDEMGPVEWFAENSLPLDEMMLGDRRWLPVILKGEKIRGTMNYGPGFATVESFEYEPLVA